MKHSMTLYEEAFDLIRSGEKRIEVRCNDEKRKKIKINDEIIFYELHEEKQWFIVKVQDLYECKTFEELYSMFDLSEFGRAEYSVKDMVEGIREIYPIEKEKTYGALGIRIELISFEQ